MRRKVQFVLKVMLLFGAIYLFIDGLIHFFDIKLLDIGNSWPASALVYAHLLDKVAGVFIFFMAAAAFIFYRNLNKYRELIYLSAGLALFLGLTFIYLGISIDYANAFLGASSLSFWLPFYGQYLILEAAVLLFYSIVVFMWFRTRSDE